MATKIVNRWGILAALAVSLLLVVLDATVLELAIPKITEDLRPSATQLLWMNDLYPLTLAGLLVTMGAAGDRFGRRRVLLAGFAVFGLASAASAFSPAADALIAARFAQAAGAAMIMPSAMSITRIVFPVRGERVVAMAVIGSVMGAGAAIGPTLGGFLLEHFWWGVVFLINVPVMILAIALGVWFIPESRGTERHPLDVIGMALSMAGIGSLVFGVKKLGHDGFSWPAVLFVVAGLAVLGLFVLWLRRTPHPLVDPNLFRNRGFSVGVIAAGSATFGMSGLLFLLAQHLMSVLGFGALRAGVGLLPLVGACVVAALLTAPVLRWIGTRAVFVTGLVLMCLALFGAWLALGLGGYWPLAAVMVVLGTGVGMVMSASNDAVLSTAPASQAGIAAATEDTSYELGTGLGIAALGGVALGAYADRLGPVAGVGPDTMNAARQSMAAAAAEAASLPGDAGTRLVAAASGSFTEALRLAAVLGGGLTAVVAVATALLMPKWITTAETSADPGDRPASVH
ncbi:MFS transporter [Amycolatopsis sp. NPDC059021]|uniref:MFS transporter n=1 Tax=Amycolatopsis sp. NPDC059021 TaxID=3346704 RepID=UPI0036726B9B